MKRWDDYKKTLVGPLTQAEVDHIQFVARLVEDIRARREQLGWTQDELAKKAGIQQSAIARLENGGAIPRIDTLYKVIRALGLDLELVVTDEQAAASLL